MRGSPDARRAALVAAIAAAGFALTVYIFYPGVMTFDARYVYDDIAKGFFGDWQSPVMTLLWSWIDPIAPGSGSLFLLTAALYWLAVALLGVVVARRSMGLALLLPFLALAPPAFVFIGIIWRDVLFAVAWLLAVAVAAAGCAGTIRIPARILALALVTFGVLLRPNAILAAPLLATYILWSSFFSWKRTAILYLPLALAFYGLVQVIYYDVLGAKQQHPLHSIMVFDLGGISHFARTNAFPGTWSPDETKLITDGCYKPVAWDIYWTHETCRFVMARLEPEENIFGTPRLVSAWKDAIIHHPLAYLRHRTAFMWTFLTRANLTMWTIDLNDTSKIAFADNPRLMALKQFHDVLKPTPLFRAGTWLLFDLVLCLFAWRLRDRPVGAFVLGICGSAVVYTMTFLFVGVATDFRYAFWAVLAALAGAVALVQTAMDGHARGSGTSVYD
jgi:hypothetical protein